MAEDPDSPSSPRLDHNHARLIRELVEDKCGLTFGLDSVTFLERRIVPRLRAVGLGSFKDYYLHLKYDEGGGQELGVLIEQLTNHETYFFRERYQLDAFRLEVLPRLVSRLEAIRSLNIWSAGCSTGEETYTLAMLLAEESSVHGWRLRVFGTDISRKVLMTARRGVYGAKSFRVMEDKERRRYFERSHAGWRVNEEVRSMTAFGHFNLLNREKITLLGTCDAIFCRNVLIYLSAEARAHIVETFYRRLRPGGYLFLGHSESLLNVTTKFEIVSLENDLVYKKPEDADD
jgi:chemotaxis protein methyltransferase CheR